MGTGVRKPRKEKEHWRKFALVLNALIKKQTNLASFFNLVVLIAMACPCRLAR